MSGAKELSNTTSANRFRHRSFKSRVEDVQIHVGKRIGKVNEEPEEGGSFFTESLHSWKELNCTADFTRYVRLAEHHAGSLAVLLYNKEKVVTTLLEHMSVPNSTALEPLLSLTTMLARDLQEEFFPYFESVVSTITSLLKYKDPAVIEAAFNAIAYLFKYLSKQLVFDLTPAFDLLAPLMGQRSAKGCTISSNAHYAQHITLFAAESFAYLLRKAPRPILEDERNQAKKSLTDVAQYMLNTLREDKAADEGSSAVAFEEGMACVFAETAKGVGNRLHSRAAEVLRTIVLCLGEVEDAADPAFTLVEHTLRILCNHTKREFIEPLWDVLTLEAKSLTAKVKDHDQNSTLLMIQTGKLLSLFSVCAASRKGARIPQEREKLQQIIDIIKTFSEYIFGCKIETDVQIQARTFTISHLQSFILSLVVFAPFSDLIQSVKPLLDLFINRADPEEALSLCVSLSRAEWSSYASIMPPYVHTSITRCWSRGSKNAVLLALEEGVEKEVLFGEHGSASSGELLATGMLTTDGLLKYRAVESTESVVDGVLSIIRSACDEKKWIAAAFPALSLERNSSPQHIGQVIAALTVLPKLAIAHMDATGVLVDFINCTIEQLDELVSMDIVEQNDIVARGGPAYAAEVLIGRALESLTTVYKRSVRTNTSSQKQTKKYRNPIESTTPMDEKSQNVVITSICRVLQKRANGNAALLLGAAEYLTAVKSSKGQRILSEEKLRTLGPHLIPLISSHCRETRLGALRILAAFDQLPMEAEKETNGDSCPVLQMALDLEERNLTVTEYRDKVMLLKKLANFISLGRVPKFYEEVLPRLCVATLTLNFQPMWQPAIEILDGCVKSSQSVVWGIIHAQLNMFQNSGSALKRDGLTNEAIQAAMESDDHERGQRHILGNDCLHLRRIQKLSTDVRRNLVGPTSSEALSLSFIKSSKETATQVDYWNYFCMLLTALTHFVQLAEQHNRDIVPAFFELTASEFEEEQMESQKQLNGKNGDTDMEPFLAETAKSNKQRLSAYLKLFAKFRNLQNVYQSARLRDVIFRLLARGDPKVQLLALEVVIAYRSPSVNPYVENLRNLVDEVKFRDELSTFPLDPTHATTTIQPQHRTELLPVVLRILYGRVVARKGKGSSKAGMGARRAAVLSALAGLANDELKIFIDLLATPFAALRSEIEDEDGDVNMEAREFVFEDLKRAAVKSIPMRKQLGFLRLLEDVQKQLAGFLQPFAKDLFCITLYLVDAAHAELEDGADTMEEAEESLEEQNKEEEEEEEEAQQGFATENKQNNVVRAAQVKDVRQTGIRRLTGFFKLSVVVDYSRFLPALFAEVLSPRIAKLPMESTQAVSPLMELLCSWGARPSTAPYLVKYDMETMPKLLACLSAKKVRDSVISAILEVVENVLAADEARDAMEEETQSITLAFTLAEQIVVPHIALLLDSLEHLLHRSAESSKLGRDNFSRREISILSRVAPYVKDSVQAAKLVELLLPHLRKPPRVVSEKVKADILRVVESFFPLIPALHEEKSPLLQRYYGAVSVLFASLSSRECRSLLHRVLERLSEIDSSLKTVALIVGDLNAYSKRRIDEPDFDRRLAGFARINEELYMTLTAREWIPLLHNLLFLINDPDELSIRNNSTYALTKFIDRVASANSESSEHEEHLNLLTHIVYPGIKKYLRSHNENVRVELVTVLAHAVKKCPELPQFSDMVCLLAGGDEEASFFINVHHLQLHRRIRALRRLADECDGEARIRPNTLVHIIMPIVSHFIFETDRQGDHNLINETVRCLGVMSKRLPWGQYYSMLRGYLGLIPKKPELEKVLVRVVISILDNFHFDISKVEDKQVSQDRGKFANQPSSKPATTEDIAEDTGESDEEDNENLAAELAEEERGRKIHDTVVQKLLPELHRYLTNRDDTTVTVRVPVALAITKLLQELSITSMEKHLPGLLTSVCQILRSRQQEARDSTRDTLMKIATRLGSAYFGFILTELRGALTRGYQLHVLGFTVHSLLESLGGEMEVGALDYCIEPLVSVLVADVFGEVGVEKETQEITGKMKEAKSMRSYESFEMLARTMSFVKIGLMLVPIKDLLRETENAKVTKKVEEALRRIAIGLNSNTGIETKDFLVFCHGLITENVELSKAASVKKKGEKSQQEKNFEVQMKRNAATEIDHFAMNAHRFVEFGLNLLQSFLKKGRIDTKSPELLSLLEPFVAATINATYSKHTRVVELAVKLLSSLIRLPLAALEKGVPVVVRRLFQLIQESSGTTSDLVQACFKLLAVAIRENNKVVVTKQQLTFLVHTIRPDLEEPERQGTTFSLIRAIISRKFVTDEVYDLMEDVSQIMITNQSSQVRELCRNVHLQFLLDYPHGKARIRTQMAFLIKNLTYIHESGRSSVLEMLHAVVGKFPDDVLAEHADALFLALVLVLVNDEAAKCREMAGALIKSLMLRMEFAGKMDRAYRLLTSWMRQGQQQRNLARTACQVYGLMIETFGERFAKQINTLLSHLQSTLEICNEILRQAEEGSMLIDGQDAGDDGPTAEWELAYYSLTTFTKLVRQFPALVHCNADANTIWRLVSHDGIMLHPHSWVRLSSARLLGLYFVGVDPKTRKLAPDSPDMLELLEGTSLRQIAYQSSVQLKSQKLGDELANQATKNLVFLGRCLYHLPIGEGAYVRKKDGEEEEEHEGLEVEAEASSVTEVTETSTKAREEATAMANHTSLLQFFKKLSFMARQAQSKNESVKQRTCIFQWFAAMTTFLSRKEIFPYLLPMIGPLYRTIMDETAKGDAVVELKNMSQEVLDLIQKKAGTTDYLFIHNQVRQRISQVREERKQKRVVQAIVDPEARAKRKLARNVTKRNGRKRKGEEFAKNREKFSTVKKRKQ